MHRYAAVIAVAAAAHIVTLAIPSISTGISGFPIAQADVMAISGVRKALANAHGIRTVKFSLLLGGGFQGLCVRARGIVSVRPVG
jgi:O-acetyl-ADP-ribose deacetylase (regulator of RNase III)